jgi:prepilin-type N-terminal cleavage/methylation domain-containing protein
MSDRTPSLLQKRARLRSQRGFTLIELIVSMMAGLLISAAAFLLARNASSFFQHEARITSAQFASVVAMSRMTGELRRASFMSTRNVDSDERLCGDAGVWPLGMQQMAGIRIENGGSVARHGADHGLSTVNGLTPDALILAGLFGSTEQFSVSTLTGGGGGQEILLQNDGAMMRTLLRAAEGGDTLDDIFRTGRYMRTGAFVRVTMAAAPALPTRDTIGLCGCEGFCTGAIVNPVSRVLYDLRSVDDATYPQFKGLYQKSGHADTSYHRGIPEPDRTELIRVELRADDSEIVNTLEILAEHAVDMKFGITAVDPNVLGNAPTLLRFDIGDPQVYVTAGQLPAGAPETIRAVQLRLSMRASERDRDVAIPVATSDGGLFRYNLGANAGFARMRTLVSEVQLVNQL